MHHFGRLSVPRHDLCCRKASAYCIKCSCHVAAALPSDAFSPHVPSLICAFLLLPRVLVTSDVFPRRATSPEFPLMFPHMVILSSVYKLMIDCK